MCGFEAPARVAAGQDALDENACLRRFYDAIAGNYDAWLGYYAWWMKLSEARKRLLAHAHGQTLEVGAGTGANFPHYPPDVQLTAVDLSLGMLEFARARARAEKLDIRLWVTDICQLGLPGEYFDTVVLTLVLSTVPDVHQAAAEIRRVLKRNGRLLVLDHVRSPLAPVRWAQQMLEPRAVSYAGWHFTRDPLDYLEFFGFTVERCRRSRLGMIQELVARKT